MKISKLLFCKKKIANLLCVLYIHFYYYEYNYSSKNSFSRLQIISLFTICSTVYFTTLQKPFNSGRSFTIHTNVLNARAVCFSTFRYYCIVANLSNLNSKTAKRLSADQAQKYILCRAISKLF